MGLNVLIETYWNVKEIDNIEWLVSIMSLNRNILECKGYLCHLDNPEKAQS